MTDKCCFVQFPHPGDEHRPDRDGKIGWNETHRNNPHKRKLMRFPGDWIDKDDNKNTDDLCAWGEWEPESECLLEFDREESRPHHPRYLWKPYWVPRKTFQCLHNTDPFIFGNCFLYSNFGQLSRSKRSLTHLDQGSVIAFGSKVRHEEKWALDTVLVVRDSFPYDPLDPRKALDGKVPEAFFTVTGGPLTADPKLRELAKNSEPLEFRLYRGATPKDPVCGMYSFFPALPAGSNSGFPRPPIVGVEQLNSRNWRTPAGHGKKRTLKEMRHLWESLVARVRNADLVLGTRAELPRPEVT